MTRYSVVSTLALTYALASVLPANSQETCRTVRDCTESILNKLTDVQEENKALAQAVNDLRSQLPPTGSIVAFQADKCPAGWSVYNRARGRFLLGTGGSGMRVIAEDEAGTLGGNPSTVLTVDHLPSHQHQTMAGVGAGDGGFGDGPLGLVIFGTQLGNAYRSLTSPVGSSSPIPISSIPPYVALLYCRRD